jgi:hypothetical protein
MFLLKYDKVTVGAINAYVGGKVFSLKILVVRDVSATLSSVSDDLY